MGVLAIANVFLSIALVIQDMGLANYFIHKQNTTKNQNACLWLISVLLGLLVAITCWLAAPYIGVFYERDEVASLLNLAGFIFLFTGAASLYNANLIKSFKQVDLAKIEMGAQLIAFSTSMSALFLFHLGVESIIFGMLAGSVARLLLFMLGAERSFHPIAFPDIHIAKPALKYGAFQLGSQIINQLRSQADNLIIGKVIGMDVLGLYSIAKDLVFKPLKFINPLIYKLILPRFAKNQDNKAHQEVLFARTVRVLSWVSCALYSTLALLSLLITFILYGSGYIQTAVILSALALFGMLRPLGGVFASLAQSMGKSNIEFYWNIIAGIMMVGAIYLSAQSHNIVLIAIILSGVQLCLTFIAYHYFNKGTGTGFSLSFIRLVGGPIVITLLLSLLATWINMQLFTGAIHINWLPI